MAQKNAAQKQTKITVMARTYLGASSALKKNGPPIFAAANTMKSMMFVVARLVCPEMFCPMIVRQNGH